MTSAQVWSAVLYFSGMSLTAGLIGGLGNFSGTLRYGARIYRGSVPAVMLDCLILVVWPIFWVVYPLYKIGQGIREEFK